ncbi:MAG: hypothetical protein KC592_09015 [Nitrospira sp.]|nr:hypothetical protein [Nitrospira sp.]HBP89730.1 hypothetical protein [Nitrospiraceae bacterium]HNP29626.1 hypothetical protein [Nitrospirales bacterium]
MSNDFFCYAVRMEKYVWVKMFCGLLMVGTLSACIGNTYQQQADVIKGHVERFYGHLQSHQVGHAVFENEQIEMIGLSSEERLLRRVGQLKHDEKIQEWKIIKTAKETAAENWLALARYFSENQQYDKARSTYQRVIETYQGLANQLYVDRAKMGLRDVETILGP